MLKCVNCNSVELTKTKSTQTADHVICNYICASCGIEFTAVIGEVNEMTEEIVLAVNDSLNESIDPLAIVHIDDEDDDTDHWTALAGYFDAKLLKN